MNFGKKKETMVFTGSGTAISKQGRENHDEKDQWLMKHLGRLLISSLRSRVTKSRPTVN